MRYSIALANAWNIAQHGARSVIGIEAEIVIREGDRSEEINAVVEEDRDIAILVLAAGPAKEGPGPLVSLIAGRGKAFSIPVTVLPDGLDDADIDANPLNIVNGFT